MRRWAIVATMVLAAGACASPQYQPSQAPRSAASAPARSPPIMSPRPVSRDACGAAELQGLVGHPRTEIPVPVDPNRQRVACTTCPVTQDFRPDRLNFFFDAATGSIREIKCG